MKTDKLLKICDNFQKQAQKKLNLNVKNINQLGKFLYNAIISYANLLRSPQAAQKIFYEIAEYHKAPAIKDKTLFRNVQTLLTMITEMENRLIKTGADPIKVLQKMGMSNVNPNILNILKNNLQTLLSAQDFSQYQHYFLQPKGQPKDIVEIDEINDKAGY